MSSLPQARSETLVLPSPELVEPLVVQPAVESVSVEPSPVQRWVVVRRFREVDAPEAVRLRDRVRQDLEIPVKLKRCGKGKHELSLRVEQKHFSHLPKWLRDDGN